MKKFYNLGAWNYGGRVFGKEVAGGAQSNL